MEILTNEFGLIGKFLLTLLLGFAIGFERELAGKPAGMRTHMLIALGTTFFVFLSSEMINYVQDKMPEIRLTPDPVRIIEAIMVGISFLGAGTILKNKETEDIENLTTAASIMVMAAIGISVAIGKNMLAIGVTILVLLINRILLYAEIWLHNRKKKYLRSSS